MVANNTTDRTPVIFRVWTLHGGLIPTDCRLGANQKNGDGEFRPLTVIALFPTVRADPRGNIQSYEAVGQHGAATLDVVLARTRPAKPCEWFPLARELVGQFDYKLRVVGTDALGERGKTNVSNLPWPRPA